MDLVSEDPIGFAAGDTNVSRYVGNGVTRAVDPSGFEEETVIDRRTPPLETGTRFDFEELNPSITLKPDLEGDADGNGIIDSEQAIWDDLVDNVRDSKLGPLKFPGTTDAFRIPDQKAGFVRIGWGFWWEPAIPGYDCDDYTFSMMNYLDHQFAPHHDVEIYYVSAIYDRNHALTLVRWNGFYTIIDPQTETVLPPQRSLEDTLPAVRLMFQRLYRLRPDQSLRLTVRPDGQPGNVPHFNENEEVMDVFEAALNVQGVYDITPYLPKK